MVAVKSWRLADLGAKHALLLAGLGWGIMPKPMVSDDIKRGRLVQAGHRCLGQCAISLPHDSIAATRRPDQRHHWLMERLSQIVTARRVAPERIKMLARCNQRA